MNNKDLYLSDERYLVVLERQKKRIEDGLELSLVDSNTIGDKYTEATWGLCSGEKEAWPDAEDHLWPDQFLNEGRVAPKYQVTGQHCPFDDTSRQKDLFGPSGCFYRCRLFQNKKVDRPDRKRALELYDERIAQAKARMEK